MIKPISARPHKLKNITGRADLEALIQTRYNGQISGYFAKEDILTNSGEGVPNNEENTGKRGRIER